MAKKAKAAKSAAPGCCETSLCAATATIAELCAEMCGGCSDDPDCAACVEACNACAEACRKCADACEARP